jgi:carbonic anhydrase
MKNTFNLPLFQIFQKNTPLSKNGFWGTFLLSILSIIALFFTQSCAFKAGVVTKNDLQKMTPAQALTRLEEGYKRFDQNQPKRYNLREQRYYIGRNGAFPPAVVVCPSDAAFSPELIFNQGLGDLTALRSPASVLTSEVAAGVENAVRRVGSKIIVLVVQTKDPFIMAAVEDDRTGNQPAINNLLRPAIDNVRRDPDTRRMRREELVSRVLREHLILNLQKLTAISPLIRASVERGEVMIVGAVYDVETGKLDFLKGEN